jgi:hypothetical protein
LCDAFERHTLNQADQVPQPPSDHGQYLQRDVKVLAAYLLKIVLVDEQRNNRTNCPNSSGIWPAIE